MSPRAEVFDVGERYAQDAPHSLIGFLRSKGAADARHAAGRTLLDHLLETHAIVRRWGQPQWLAHAALMHSVYGTDHYRHQLLPLSQRREVAELVGTKVERVAFLFSAVPRGPLLAGTYRWAPVPLDGDEPAPTRDELDALLLLHMANLAEQARGKGGGPGTWLSRLRTLGELLSDSEVIAPPSFVGRLAGLSAQDEALARRSYRAGVALTDAVGRRIDRLALAASLCPVIPEPCLWLAHLSLCEGDLESARWWVGCARKRLADLGTAWDKRLSFEQWQELAQALGRLPAGAIGGPAASPERLFQTVAHAAGPSAPPMYTDGRKRFHRYVESLAEDDGSPLGGIYPDLASQPWLDPTQFAVARYLESHYDAIRDEILALAPFSFHREAERIERSGDWNVAFFYERGRRRDEICDACPVTARGIEADEAVRTLIGLSYASRMGAGTHIAAHRGPTNLRVRCHLGIKVPRGDCAIRVGDTTRRWQEGKCLVFDDHFEHEAWNHTGEDRIVLIVDLWHPGLSPREVSLLEGLHAYAFGHARRLTRYWAANAAAARESG